MKIDRGKIKKCSSEVPSDCKALIDKLKSCNQFELFVELKKIKIWNCGKCELYHWIDVLDLFDTILEEACYKSSKGQWSLPCDMPGFEDKKDLLLQILHFTALLIEHSFSRHLYNSMEHLTTLLSSCDMQVVLGVLNLLYIFSKRSNFITRLNGVKKQALLSRLTYLSESWGGKENGFGLAQCCQDLPITNFPSSATTLHFEFYDDNNKSDSKKSHLPTCIHIENVDKMEIGCSANPGGTSAAEIMENIVENYAVPESKAMLLFTHVRLAHCFSNYQKRSQCVQARLQALSILVYSNALQDNSSSLLYNGLIEELVDVLELKDPNLIEIKAASLRTLTSVIHLERNPRLNAIIDATGASSYHGFLPILVRSCIQALTDSSLTPFPLPFATALFSCLYHLASYEAGGEALVSCGMMESLLKVVNWRSTEPEHITFVTRAVRVIDLITNLDMTSFQAHNGLTAFINRLEVEVEACRKEQPFVIRTRCRNSSVSSLVDGQASSSTSQSGLNSIAESIMSPMDVDSVTNVDSPMSSLTVTSGAAELKSLDFPTPKTNVQCLPQRAALLKSMLNFLKKVFQEPSFSDGVRHVMDGPLPSSLKHIISNAEYYGPSLFLLATDVVTVYVFQEPSLLSSLQDNGLTDVVLQALLVKDVPAAREVLASLPNVFSALCLNSRGLQAFVACKPFERLFKVLLSPDYLQAMRRRRSSDPMGDTASNLGNAVDELMRHQPSLKADATSAIIKLLEEVCAMGNDPKYVCTRPTTSNKIEIITSGGSSSNSGQRNSSTNRTNADGGASSDDEDDEDEESSTTSSNLKNGPSDGASGEDKNIIGDNVNNDSSKTPVPLVDYVLNVMKFVDAILSNNSTDDHCREFVAQKGLVPLMNVFSLPNLPIDFPVTPACQAIAAVCKSILNLAHEPEVLKQGLVNLNNVLESLEPLHKPPTVSCSTVLLSELASVAPNSISETTANAHTTPLLHAMSAAHAFIMMFVHVCRTGQTDIRAISINHWGSELGLKVLKHYVMDNHCLVTVNNMAKHITWRVLSLGCLILSTDSSVAGKSSEVTTAMEALSTDSPSSAPMEVDELVETLSGDTKNVKTKFTPAQQAQVKHIKPLLTGSSRLGRALAELFGLLVKLCVGLPMRQRRGQQMLPSQTVPSPAARAVASALTELLANGLSWQPPLSFPSPYLRMTFFICSIGFTSPMLFDEKKYPYHLMLQKFLSSGGQDAFFDIFRKLPEITEKEGPVKQDVLINDGLPTEDYSNILSLVDLILSLPVLSAECERVFSNMKLVKSDWRSVLKSKNLSDQLMVILATNDIDQYDPLPAIRLWNSAGSKPRRPCTAPYGVRSCNADLESDNECNNGTGEFLDAWLMLLEKMINHKTILESPHTLPAQSTQPDYTPFSPVLYLIHSQKQAFELVMQLWNRDPLQVYGARISESILLILCHILKSESIVQEKLVLEKESATEASSSTSATTRSRRTDEADVNPEHLQQLMDMGFSQESATDALFHCSTVEQATDYLLSNPAPYPIRSSNEDAVKVKDDLEIENEKQKEETPIEVDIIDEFTATKLIPGCMKLLDHLSDTVYRVCDLLVTVVYRNGPKWRDLMINGLLDDIKEKLKLLMAAGDEVLDWPNFHPLAMETAARVHLLTLLFEELRLHCVPLVKASGVIEQLVDVLIATQKVLSANKEFLTPRWLAPVLLLIDMFEKVCVASERRAKMITVSSHTWRWFDERTVRWCSYGGGNNKTIDDAFRAGKHNVQFTAGRRKYKIYFGTMLQVSDETGNRRPVMLTLKSKEEELKLEKDLLNSDFKVAAKDEESNEVKVVSGKIYLCSVCVSFIEIPVESDTLHAVLRLCLRLTRNHNHASLFANLGGIRLLIGLTQASSFTGFISLATLLIRHVLEEPISLKMTMEKVIRTAIMFNNTSTTHKELHFLFRVVAPAICREPELFTEIAKSILRISLPPLKRGEDDLESRISGNNAVQILKCLPTKSTSNICALSGHMEEAIVVLLDALIVKVQYDEESAPQTNPTPANPDTIQNMSDLNIQRRTNPDNMPHISRNSSANDLLQQDDEDISQSMDTSSDVNEVISKKSEKKDTQATDEAVKKTRPLIPKSSICRLLAELVRSYPGCAKLISEYSYRECQSELITEVKQSLGRVLATPESLDKHSKIQSFTTIINTMIESCPSSQSNTNHNILTLKPQSVTMNNMVKLIVKKGLVADLAKIPHSLDLSSPSLAATINNVLKPLEVLSRVINQPIGNTTGNKGIKSKSTHASSSDIRSSTPAPVPEASSLTGSLSQGDLTAGANEEQSQATNALTTESDNTNTQDDITTEDTTENDGLDLSIPADNSTVGQNEDSGEEMDEIMDRLIVRDRNDRNREAVDDMLMTLAESAAVGGRNEEDDRDSQQILIAMDTDMSMDDHPNSQMINPHNSVYDTPGDDHHRESSDSDSDSEPIDEDHEERDDDADDDDDDDDEDDDEGSPFEAEDEFADWEDQIFRVHDRNEDLFFQLEEMFPAALRDYSLLFSGTSDSTPQFRTLQVPLRDEGPNVDATQAIPPAPGTVTPSHPLLVRHTDPHGAVTYRVYRGNGRQRGYRLSTPSAAWHVYSGGRRHQNPPILPGAVGLSTRLLVSNDEFRFMAPEDDLFDLQEQPGVFSNAVTAIPSASVRWAEESRVLDGDSIHDCVACVKPEIIEVLEKHRDEEIADRKEKKLKQKKEELLKKSQNKENAKDDDESTPVSDNSILASANSNVSASSDIAANAQATSTPNVPATLSSNLTDNAVDLVSSSNPSTEMQTPAHYQNLVVPNAPTRQLRSSEIIQTPSLRMPEPFLVQQPSAERTPGSSDIMTEDECNTSDNFLEDNINAANDKSTTDASNSETVEQSTSESAVKEEYDEPSSTSKASADEGNTEATSQVDIPLSDEGAAIAATLENRNEMTPIEEENSALSSQAESDNLTASLLGDIEIPEGVDPSFLAALPDSIRQEVIAEQLRLQRLRQPPQEPVISNVNVSISGNGNGNGNGNNGNGNGNRSGTVAASSSAEGNFTEVSPEFLAALPPNIQEEVLQQQRQEQQRLAVQNSNPEAPVDPAGFIQTLPPSLRQQVLADMDDSVIAVLPSELASEAQTLRREVEARQRQLHERFFTQGSAFSSILRNTDMECASVPQSHLAWAISQSVGNSSRSNTLNSSVKVRGRQLLDHEGLTCLLVLLFVDEPRLNTTRLHRVLRNLSYHAPTREWIIKSLLDIMGKTEACQLPCITNSKDKDENVSKSLSKKKSNFFNVIKQDGDTVSGNTQPAWLSISLDAALGCRATVFQIHRPHNITSHSKGKSPVSSSNSQSISVHPQASPIICRHVLDTLISLAKCFSSHFLPSTIKETCSKSSAKNKSSSKRTPKSDSKSISSPSSTSQESFKTDFWDLLIKLDSMCSVAGSTKTKGKSLMKPHGAANTSLGFGSVSDEDKKESVSFESSPLGLLISMLSHPVIKRSSLLTDRLLRLLALVSLGLPEQQNNIASSTTKTPSDNNSATNNQSSAKSNAKTATTPNCDTDDVGEKDEDMETEEEKKRERDSIEQHLKLAVEVLTSKSCSEEGLEDATALLVQLSRGGGGSNVTRETVLKLLLEGANKLGAVVCSHIRKLMNDLQTLNQTRQKSDKEIGSEDFSSEPVEGIESSAKTIGVLHDRFTQASVVVTAPNKVKAGRELQIPAMAALTSKTSSQAFFLRVLKVIIQLQDAAKFATKKSKRRSSLMSLFSAEDILGIIVGQSLRSGRQSQSESRQDQAESVPQIAQPQQPSNTSNAVSILNQATEVIEPTPATDTPMEVDGSAQSGEFCNICSTEKVEDEGPRLSEQLALEDLWTALSDCLLELADTPDDHAVLVLQPAVEAFFLVHASAAEKESAQNASKPESQESQLSHLHQDIAPVSPQPSSSDTSRDNIGPSRQLSVIAIPTNLPPDTQKFLRFAETHRTVLNQILRQSTTHLADGPFAVLVDHTRILDFDVKRRYFRQELERMDEGIRREDLAVHIRREQVFEDSYRDLHRRPAEEWKNRFYIVFEGEEGQDAGGLLREWYMIVSREIFNPNYALFTTSPGDRVTYMINPSSHCNSNHLSYFKFVGRVIAKAIYDNKLLDCYFTRSFYNHILGKPVKHTDMESEDYAFYQGLVFLLENGVKELGYDLSFSTEVQEFGVTEARDLKPDGRNLYVTEENKNEYVRLVCQMKMTGAIRKQINSFLEGFYDIIPKRLISIFNEQELELLISGLPVIDIDDLKANTEYHKYQPNSLQIQWFWRALRSFDQADRAKFLQFVTGTSKVPLQGFATLEGMNGTQKFQIHRDDRSTDRLPSAHTCFNQLDLPAYETYDKLKQMLLIAVHECSEGFGFA
ncbi:E3 ubiquitin-protein ligase HUWE1 [Nymphon striatum]|nr:E3 ubiquitin-protein ligase HUWE1 [Nymphon striatum]